MGNLNPRPGPGRPKGAVNKPVGIFSVRARIQELGIDLIGEIIEHINDITEPEPKARLKLQLLEYCDSRRKAVEVIETKIPEKAMEGLPIEVLADLANKKLIGDNGQRPSQTN